MPRVVLLACARSAAVDRFSNQVSIFELLEDLIPVGYPLWLPSMVAVVVLARTADEAEDYPCDIDCTLGGNLLLRHTLQVSFQGGLRSRQIVTINGIPIETPGTLAVRLTGKGISPAEYAIEFRPVALQVKEEHAPIGAEAPPA
jgi:hypothetical protein